MTKLRALAIQRAVESAGLEEFGKKDEKKGTIV